VRRPALVRCFLDDDIRRGLIAVIQDWNRCVVCGEENDDPHDAQPHSFAPADMLDLFLDAAQRPQEETGATGQGSRRDGDGT
jgi:hypothetical protein